MGHPAHRAGVAGAQAVLRVALSGVGYIPCPYPLDYDWLVSWPPITTTREEGACIRMGVGPYRIGPTGSVTVSAGETVVLGDGTRVEGELTVVLDPFLTIK